MSDADARGSGMGLGRLERISAVTLATADMARAVAWYQVVGFRLLRGGPGEEFTTFTAGDGFVNLQHDATWEPGPRWGRVIVWVDDVDATYRRALDAGLTPEAEPVDAPWGERYFHLRDPDGHELSFAHPLAEPGR